MAGKSYRGVRKSVIQPKGDNEINKLPNQVCDYLKSLEVGTRFDCICDLYLQGLTIDDLQYLKPEDLICLVPQEQHQHKLLMTILVTKYIYKSDTDDDSSQFCSSYD